mgnify:CR=1
MVRTAALAAAGNITCPTLDDECFLCCCVVLRKGNMLALLLLLSL